MIKEKNTVTIQWGKLDVALASLGLLAGLTILVIAVVVVPDQFGLAIALLATSGGYLIMRKSLGGSRQTQSIVGGEAKQRVWLVRVATGCVLVLSALVAGISYNSMGRPYWVLFLLSIIPVCILFQILLFSQLSKELEAFLLLQIVFLLAAIVFSSIYTFPHDGGDTVVHIRNAASIVNSGTIDGIQDAYRNYPFYPATIAALSELLELDLQQAARLNSLVGALISLLSLYGLARICYSANRSLVLALLLAGSQWFIYWTTALVVSMVTALWFFCLFVAITLKRLSGSSRPQTSLAIIIFAASVPFFHPLGAAAVVMLFSASSMLDLIMSGRRSSQWRRSIIGLSILTAVITLTQWIYYGPTLEDALRRLANTTLGVGQFQLSSSYRSTTVYNLDHLNLHLLYFLSGLGILRELQSRQSKIDIYTGIVGLGFALFGYLPQALGIEVLLGHRWLLFASLLLIFPASSTLLLLIHNRHTIVRTLLFVGIAVYFLLALGSPANNLDSPLYGKEFVIPFKITHSDYAGLSYLHDLTEARLTTDRYLCIYLIHSKKGFQGRLNCWSQVDFTQIEGLFTFRDAYLDRRMTVGRDLTSQDLAFQEESDVVLLYDNGNLKVFERIPASSYGSE
jgi:hypothetical protein